MVCFHECVDKQCDETSNNNNNNNTAHIHIMNEKKEENDTQQQNNCVGGNCFAYKWYLFAHDAIQNCNAISYYKGHQMNCEVDIRDKHGTVLIWSCHADQQTLLQIVARNFEQAINFTLQKKKKKQRFSVAIIHLRYELQN